MMSYIMVFYDSLEKYEGLSNEQFGRLIRAGLVFARDGTEPELDGPEKIMFPGLKLQIMRDAEKYREKCEKNRENIQQRWGQKPEAGTDTNVYDRIRPNTNAYETYQDKDKDKSKDQDKDNDKDQDKSKDKARAELLRDGYTGPEIDAVLSRTDAGKVKNLKAYVKAAIEKGRKASAQQYEQRDYQSSPEEKAEDFNSKMELIDQLTNGGNS